MKDDWITKQKGYGTCSGLQIIFQNLSDIKSGRNKIPSEIYENLSDINFYKNFIKF